MEKIKKLREFFDKFNIDGYIVPKNDKFFGEYIPEYSDNLKYLTNFSGSAGFAIILREKKYIFVDGRYTVQANIQCEKNYTIYTIPKQYPTDIFKKKVTLGFDPKLHTENSINRIFKNSFINLQPIKENLINLIREKKRGIKLKRFYQIKNKFTGLSAKNKIIKILKIIKLKKVDYFFITASENVAWLLNIRGSDSLYSPIPNTHALIDKKGGISIFCNLIQISSALKKSFGKRIKIHNFSLLPNTISEISSKKILIDPLTCSVYFKTIIKKNNLILEKEDPIYDLKSIKNKTEIRNTIKSHIYDGVALTKFIFWIKNNFIKKKITEITAEKKLLQFRKKNKSFRYLSFPTISGTGPNGAIIHYRASKKSNKVLKKGDIYLIDSGGQYSYGTTDVTRTLSLDNKNNKIKEIFTRVLKGHIAVCSYSLNKYTCGNDIDKVARKPLKEINLNYPHGTGHGVGYFLNVHEGPQSISSNNKTKFKEGMITSNEPGFYKKGHFGIRIENLIYVKKFKQILKFENLTLVPIDKDLIERNLLNTEEKKWLNEYHGYVFKNLKKYMNKFELDELKQACSNIK